MNETITIEVTAEDIAKGKPQAMSACPIALAAVRQFRKRPRRVCVTDDGVELFHPYRLYQPINAREAARFHRFIENVDEGRKVRPSKFKVRPQ